MGLVGSLDDLSLPDLLQVLGLVRKSGLLRLHGEAGEGWILLEGGQVAGAYVKGGAPDLSALLRQHAFDPGADPDTDERSEDLRRDASERAVLQMLAWSAGEFRFDAADTGEGIRGTGLLLERPIPGEYLALEAVRIQDESAAVPSSPIRADVRASADDPPAPTERIALPLVVIDPALGALEWLKSCLAGSFSHVHVFQRTELGVMRIRQYLARAEYPVVLLARNARPDPVTGIRDSAELVTRFAQQAPRMPIVLLVERDGPPTALRAPAARGLAAVVARPSVECLRDPRARAEIEAAGRLLRDAIVAAVLRTGDS